MSVPKVPPTTPATSRKCPSRPGRAAPVGARVQPRSPVCLTPFFPVPPFDRYRVLMRRVGVLLAVVLSFLVAVPASAAPAHHHRTVTLRVLSYNIHTGIGSDGAL